MRDDNKKRSILRVSILLILIGVLFIVIGRFLDSRAVEEFEPVHQIVSHIPLDAALFVHDGCEPIRKEPEEQPEESIEVSELSGPELYCSYVVDICKMYDNVDPDVIYGIIWMESRYIPDVSAGTESDLHIGLMQVSNKWHASRAEKLGVTDWYDPYSNILLGVDYFSELMSTYKDTEKALTAYHYGNIKNKSKTYANTVLSKVSFVKSGGVLYG